MLLLGAIGGLRRPGPAYAQATSEIWGEPVNLSQSGAASGPALAAAPNGTLHALWWDQFDGTKYSFFRSDLGWSRPVTVRSITGGRERTGPVLPPSELVFLVDSTNVLHVFWLSAAGDLMYSRKPATTSDWSIGTRLATAPLAWDVFLDARNHLHLAVIKPLPVGNLPAGVIYRDSVNSGLAWSNSILVAESLYFRTLDPARAHVTVYSDGAQNTFVTWDDPQLGESIYARADAQRNSFGEPLQLARSVSNELPPTHAHLLSLPNGGLMALWQSGASCALYQQQLDATGEAWTPALRALESLTVCPSGLRTYHTSDGKLFLVLDQPGDKVAFANWDGTTWSEPYASEISFINPATNRTTNLGCLKVALSGDHAAAMGCDQNGDVWVTSSQVVVGDMLPALQTAWKTPNVLSQATGDSDLPAMAVDTSGLTHLLWSEADSAGSQGEFLTYARGDGQTWTLSPRLLRTPAGKAVHPSLAADAGGLLHAVWSGGPAGQIFYSQAFMRDATTTAGWTSPVPLPTPLPTGAWPNLTADKDGVLRLVFAIPLNEGRGVYALHSTDSGATWSAPQVVFDAVAAGWPMVGETRLAADAAGGLHVLWTQVSFSGEPVSVHYAHSLDGGESWSAAALVSDAQAGHPRLLAAAPDTLHRTWTQNYLDRLEIWHQTSQDRGQTWSAPVRALDTSFSFTAETGLASDGLGGVYLSGIERTVTNAVALFTLRWDGATWGEHELLPLGFDPAEASGAALTVLPSGNLGAFFRVRAPLASGAAHYVIGYTQRPIEAAPIVALPTFTPVPPSTAVPTNTPAPTAAPSPTPDLSDPAIIATNSDVWLRMGGVLAAMLLVSGVAVVRLWGARRR